MKLLIQVIESVLKSVDKTRVGKVLGLDLGIRISPFFNGFGINDSNPLLHFTRVLKKVNEYKLAYVSLTEPDWGQAKQGKPHLGSDLNPLLELIEEPTKVLRIGGYLIVLMDRFTKDTAEAVLSSGKSDLVGFGSI